VFDLANELKGLNKKYAEILHNKAIWYFQSFTYKVVGARILEKNFFYKLVKENRQAVSFYIQFTSLLSKLLIHPTVGFLLSIMLKPLYVMKNRIKYYINPKQDWSY